jgi:hypothetical protein
MKVSQGVHYWLDYQNLLSRKTPTKPRTFDPLQHFSS